MTFIIENWFLIVIAVVLLVMAIALVIKFVNLPTKKKLETVKSWLLIAVTKAEIEYGSKTGKLKLAFVYDMFISKFPALSRWVSFEMFSSLVDEALTEFKKMLNNSDNLKEYVEVDEI